MSARRTGADMGDGGGDSGLTGRELFARLSPVGIFRTDPAGAVVEANAAFHRLTGVAEGGHWLDAVDPDDDHASLAADWRDIVVLRQAARVDFRVRRAGRGLWMRVEVAPDLTSSGRLLGFVGTLSDIDDLKRTEAKLAASEERLRVALDAGGLGCFDWDLAGDRVEVTEGYRRVWGLAPGEAVSLAALSDRMHPDDRGLLRSDIGQGLRGSDNTEREFRIVDANGTVRWLRNSARTHRDATGRAVRRVGVVSDITASRDASDALGRSEERLRVALDAANLGLWEWDVAAGAGWWSRRAREIMGVEVDRLMTTEEHLALIHPDDRRIATDATLRLIRNGESFAISYRVCAPGKPERWVATRGAATRDADGRTVRATGTIVDITAERMASERLRLSEERLRLAQAAGEVGVFDWNVVTDATWWSPEQYRIHGWERDAPPSYSEWQALVHPDDLPRVQAEIYDATAKASRYEIDYRVIRPTDGAARWVSVRAEIVRDTAGAPLRIVGGLTDVTTRREIEAALAARVAELAAISDVTPAAIWVAHDTESRSVTGNRTARELLGSGDDDDHSPAETAANRQRRFRVFRNGVEVPLADQPLSRAARGETVDEEEWELRFAEGRVVAMLGAASPLLDADGRPRGGVLVALDISDMRAAQQALTASEARYRTLFDTMDEGFCVIEFVNGPDGPLSDYVHIEANPAYTVNAGIPDIVGKRLREIVSPAEADAWAAIYRQVLISGEPARFERELVETGRHLELAAFRVGDANLRQVAVLFQDMTARKTAERALAESEERLRLAADNAEVGFWDVDVAGDRLIWPARTKALFGISPDVPVTLQDFFDGLHADDLEATAAAYAAAADPAVRALYDVEYRTVGKEDGVVRWVAAKGRGVFAGEDADAACLRVAGTVIEISARKQAESIQAAQAAILVAAAADAPMPETLAAVVQAMEGHSATGVLASILLADEGQLSTGAAPSLPAAYSAAIDGIVIGEGVGSCGTAAHRREPVFVADIASDPLWADFRDLAKAHGLAACWSTPILSTTGALLGTFALYYREPREADAGDRELIAFVARTVSLVIERGRAETARATAAEAVAASERLLRAIGDSTPDLIFAKDYEGRLLYANPATVAVIGKPFEQLAGRREDEWHDNPAEAAAIIAADRRIMETGVAETIEEPFTTSGGPHRVLQSTKAPMRDASGKVAGLVGVTTDITERKAAEKALRTMNATLEARVAEAVAAREIALAQLHESQKLETLGQLTGGVAHDFNNLLTPIVGAFDVLKRRHGEDVRDARLIDGGIASAERARTLVQRLLAFGRRQLLQAKPVDVAGLINGMMELIRGSTGSRIVVETDLPNGLPPARVDPNQLEMALLNLAINARDAMPEGGRLQISTMAETAGASHPAGLTPGDYLRLDIADTGTGMSEETLRRAVEPFFTTKGVGKGTGLGLSMAHGLAAQSGGALDIVTAPGEGTTIRLWLPMAEAEPLVPGDPALASAKDVEAAACVLLVDDEELVRLGTADMLSDLGYSVIEAESGPDALRILDEGARIDALITDFLMPDMTGGELVRAARVRRPGMPALIVTGYVDPAGLGVDAPVIAKPFRQADLAARLAGLMAAV